MHRVDAHLPVVVHHAVELVQVPVGEGEVDLHPEPRRECVPDALPGTVEGPGSSAEGVMVFPVQAVHAHRRPFKPALREASGSLFGEEGAVGPHGRDKPGVPRRRDELEDVLPEKGFTAAQDQEAKSRPFDGADECDPFGGGEFTRTVVSRPRFPVAVPAEKVAPACGVP